MTNFILVIMALTLKIAVFANESTEALTSIGGHFIAESVELSGPKYITLRTNHPSYPNLRRLVFSVCNPISEENVVGCVRAPNFAPEKYYRIVGETLHLLSNLGIFSTINSITEVDVGLLWVNKRELIFPDTSIGDTSIILTSILKNTGTTPVSSISVSLSENSMDFMMNTDCHERTLQPQETCLINVTFTPQSRGLKENVCDIRYHNGTDAGGLQKIKLKGNQKTLVRLNYFYSWSNPKCYEDDHYYPCTIDKLVSSETTKRLSEMFSLCDRELLTDGTLNISCEIADHCIWESKVCNTNPMRKLICDTLPYTTVDSCSWNPPE